MAVNEVIVNGETIVDLKSDTVTPQTLAEGATAHDASGEEIVGLMQTVTAEEWQNVANNSTSAQTIAIEAFNKADEALLELDIVKNDASDAKEAAFIAKETAESAQSTVDDLAYVCVRYDVTQNVTEEYKAQARANIGVVGTGKDGEKGDAGFGFYYANTSVKIDYDDIGVIDTNDIVVPSGRTLQIGDLIYCTDDENVCVIIGFVGQAQVKIIGNIKGEQGIQGIAGTSVTVSSVVESTESGGTNVVNFSDGKKVNIKNGLNGKDGTNGKDGVDGKDYVLTDDDKEEIADLTNVFVLSVPNTIYCTVGNEFRMYFKNICSREDILFWFGTSSGLTLKKYSDYLSVTATAKGTKSLNYKIYSKSYNLLTSGNISFVISEDVINNSKILVIGDSTVTQGNAIVTQIYNRYADADFEAVLLGTRGTSPYLHEGRAGWTAEKYCTVASDSSYSNPFYNNGFDFSYYMQQQNYDNVGAVIIQLGINDIFSMRVDNYNSATALGYINTMINSIKAYNADVKVILSLIIPPNSNGTSFADAYGTSQIDWVHRYNCIRFAKETMEYFAGAANVYFSANNCVLDTDTDINDGVHPTSEGYVKLGNAIYDTLANVGVASSGAKELWDAGKREAKIKSYANVSDTRTISNDYYYYPCAYTGAWVNNFDLANVAVGSNSLQFSAPSSAYGIFVPFIGLDSTKTYRLTVNPTVAGFRVYLVDYDSTGVYKGNHIVVDKTTGLTTYDFTPTAGYQQGFCFACLSGTKDTLGVFTDLSLVEVP